MAALMTCCDKRLAGDVAKFRADVINQMASAELSKNY